MIWIVAFAIALITTWLFSDPYTRDGNMGGVFLVGLLLCIFGNLAAFGIHSEETTESLRIVTPIERTVINDEVTLTFTTEDNRMWSVPMDTRTVVGLENTLILHSPTKPPLFWSVMQTSKIDYKTLTVTS